MKMKRLVAVAAVVVTLLTVWQVGMTSAREPSSSLACVTPGPTPPPSAPRSITAHKFYDANRNGQQDEGEPDIEGWLIRLYTVIDHQLTLVAEATTGPDGTVTFTDLLPQPYKVWEETRPCWEPTTPNNGKYWEGGYYVFVDLGKVEHGDVHFGNAYTCRVILEPDEAENVLPQDTSHQFTATVLEDDTPVPGVWVSFSTDFGYFEGDGQYVERMTNDAGQATVTLVSTEPGTAHVRAWIDGDGDDTFAEWEVSDDPSVKDWVLAPPELEVSKTADPALWRSYRWDVLKEAEPTSLELGVGESGEVVYTIQVERAVGEETYSVSGLVSAENTGGIAAELVNVVDCVEYLPAGGDEYATLQCTTLQEGGSIDPGTTTTWEYTVSFVPAEGAEAYRNRVDVTISNHPEGEYTYTAYAPFDLPAEPTETEDACVTVTDEQEIPAGFVAEDDYPEGGWRTCESATFTVHKTVTNESAEPGDYELVNVAAVTGEDTGEGPTDTVTVTLTVPEAPPELEVSKTADPALWRSYRWDVLKEAEPTSLELGVGESGEVVYTIQVERAVGEETYSVSGLVSAENTGGIAAELVNVVDCVEYLPAGGDEYATLQCTTLQEGGSIDPGTTTTWEYTVSFVPAEGAEAYRNRVDVTISNHPEGEYTYTAYAPFDLPAEPTETEDACVTVTDEQEIPAGFVAEDDYPEGGWRTCESATFTVHKTVTNESAEPGDYELVNVAAVTGEDTGEGPTDTVTVTLTVPTPPPPVETSKTAEPAWTRSYTWTVEKSVSPELLNFTYAGEEGYLTYEIIAHRYLLDEAYSVHGTIQVTNNTGDDIYVLQVEDAIEYLSSGEWHELTRTSVGGDVTVPDGNTETWDYDISFEPVEGAEGYRNVAYITIQYPDESQEVFTPTADFSLPDEPTEEVDECATVTDVQEVPEGFTATDDYPEGGWHVCESTQFFVNKTVTLGEAISGTYYLTNTATVAGDDTGQGGSDSAVVELDVSFEGPTPSSPPPTTVGDAPTLPGSATPAEGNVGAAPAVVSQPAVVGSAGAVQEAGSSGGAAASSEAVQPPGPRAGAEAMMEAEVGLGDLAGAPLSGASGSRVAPLVAGAAPAAAAPSGPAPASPAAGEERGEAPARSGLEPAAASGQSTAPVVAVVGVILGGLAGVAWLLGRRRRAL